MIQDVHVETYGSLSKKEKAEYILQQIRLNLLKKDYVRALIQSRYATRMRMTPIFLCYEILYSTPTVSVS